MSSLLGKRKAASHNATAGCDVAEDVVPVQISPVLYISKRCSLRSRLAERFRARLTGSAVVVDTCSAEVTHIATDELTLDGALRTLRQECQRQHAQDGGTSINLPPAAAVVTCTAVSTCIGEKSLAALSLLSKRYFLGYTSAPAR